MKLAYYADTDTLYIGLRNHASAESEEVSEGIVFDYGEDGSLVGIEIETASARLDLKELVVSHLPVTPEPSPR